MRSNYPKGLSITERVLVQMLREQRCWDDIQSITQALLQVRFTAEQLKNEQDRMFADTNCEYSTDQADDLVVSKIPPKGNE